MNYSVLRRTFVSYRERQLYALKQRTEMISLSLDQNNILPIRPVDPENRPTWSQPLLKTKEAIGRFKYFNISPQITDFKRLWRDTFGQDLDERALLDSMFDKYQAYSNAVATGNLEELFPLVTVNLYALAKKEIDSRPKFTATDVHPVKLHWCIHKIHSMHQLSNAVSTTFGTSVRGVVAAISVRFDCEQELYALVGAGRKERVSLKGPQRVKEHIVFVRDMDGKFHEWKIAGVSEAVDTYYTDAEAFSAMVKEEETVIPK